MNRQAATACRRCREHKQRCSREQPECRRCERLQTKCVYPDPPDRKLLASLRAPPRKRKRRNSECTPGPGWPRSLDQSNDPITGPSNPAAVLSGESKLCLPDTHVQEILQDLHFTYTIHASFIIHRPTFIRQSEENQLPQCILLAICAMGTVFAPFSKLAQQNIHHLRPLGDLKALGKQWALRAGPQALQDIDRPTLVGAQTCQILALYWFAVGDTQRCIMFSAIAYRATSTLLESDKHTVLLAHPSKTSHDRSMNWIESETLRRCFWAAYIMHCVTSDLYVVGSSLDTRVLGMPLPANADSFRSTAKEATITASQMESVPPTISEERHPERIHVAAEVVKMTMNWAGIRDHIEARRRLPAHEILAELFSLDQKLSNWASNLPSTFAYSKRNLYEQLVINQQPGYAAIFATFHQCKIVLHSSLVPQFSGLPNQSGIPLQAVRTSARTALDSATAMSELAADLLALEWDPVTLAPFLGYCMYVSASIHIAMIFSKNDQTAMKARSRLLSSLKLLEAMKPFWIKLERLWARALLLYKAQVKSFSDRSCACSVDSRPDLSDLDQIACIPRRTKELAEPLAESVLQYRLENSTKNSNTNVPSSSIRELENTVHDDEVAQLANERLQQAHQVSSVKEPEEAHHPTPSDPSQVVIDSRCFGNPELCPSLPQDFLFGDASDWSECNIDMLSSTMLSFDELLTGNEIL